MVSLMLQYIYIYSNISTSDTACGGFEGACDKNAGRCDCEKGTI